MVSITAMHSYPECPAHGRKLGINCNSFMTMLKVCMVSCNSLIRRWNIQCVQKERIFYQAVVASKDPLLWTHCIYLWSHYWGHSQKPCVAYFICLPVLSVLSHLITTQHPKCWNVSQRQIVFIRCGRPWRNLYAEFSSQNLGESGSSSGMGCDSQYKSF